MLAPAPPNRHTQFVDVRDLARWLLALAERRTTRTFDATGLPISVGDLLATCAEATGNGAIVEWNVDQGDQGDQTGSDRAGSQDEQAGEASSSDGPGGYADTSPNADTQQTGEH